MKTLASTFLGLMLVAMATVVAIARADAAAGKEVFQGSDCQSCHYTQGPATEKSIADQLAKKGPELWYAGSKFQQPWLEAWLQDPQPIRPMKFNSVMEPSPGGIRHLTRIRLGRLPTT